jgi:predicted glycoside hydrolase/deacetylase ChbG (UPF0249 family)
MKKLVVVADDFGFSSGVNKGHIEAHIDGIVTEHSFMVDCPGSVEARDLSARNDIKSIGIHLSLMNLNKTGKYLRKKDYLEIFKNDSEKKIQDHIKSELKKFEDLFEMYPTHINGHQMIHAHSKVRDVVAEYALKHNIFIRRPRNISGGTAIDSKSPEKDLEFFMKNNVKMTDYFFEQIIGDYKEVFSGYIKDLKSVSDNKTVELLFHPGYVDETLLRYSSLTNDRVRDLKLLKDKSFKDEIKKLGFDIISFKKLFD